MGDYHRKEARKKFAEIKARVQEATTVEDLKAAMMEFMDMYEMHTHEVPGEMTECGRNHGEDTDPPMGW